jgi:hypothetical protein
MLLLHDIHPATVGALPGLLKELKDKGFHIVQLVPSASYVIAMANKPKARIAAAAFAAEPIVDDAEHGAPRWPQAFANGSVQDTALPVPDAAAFEPDAVSSEDVADVQWPVQLQVTMPAAAKAKNARKHKFAHSADKRKRLAHAANPQRPAVHARKDRRERIRAGVDGRHAENGVTSPLKPITALSLPA